MDNYVTNSIVTVSLIIASAVMASLFIKINGGASTVSNRAEQKIEKRSSDMENSDILSYDGKTIKGSSIVRMLKTYGDRTVSIQVMKEDQSSYMPFIYYLSESNGSSTLRTGKIPSENETFELVMKAPFADYYKPTDDTAYSVYSGINMDTASWYKEIKDEKSQYFISPDEDFAGHVAYSSNGSPVGIIFSFFSLEE